MFVEFKHKQLTDTLSDSKWLVADVLVVCKNAQGMIYVAVNNAMAVLWSKPRLSPWVVEEVLHVATIGADLNHWAVGEICTLKCSESRLNPRAVEVLHVVVVINIVIFIFADAVVAGVVGSGSFLQAHQHVHLENQENIYSTAEIINRTYIKDLNIKLEWGTKVT